MKILKVKCLAPTRLDNYLMQQFPALNPGRLNKALRENKIKLNGKKQPLSTRVMAGDEIKLFILDEVLDADKRVEGPAWKNARGPAQVIYDCPQILVVNKPAGLAVDGPEDDTLLNRALLYLNQQGEYKENDLYTPALCHRLDTGTSGLVIIAKTPEAEQLFLGSGPVPYFPELFLLLQQLGMIVLQSFPSIFDRVWKLGKFFINNIAGTDDDKGEQPQAEVPEKSVSPGFPFGILLPGGFFFRSVFRDDVQGGFQTFFGCGGGVFILMFSSVLLRSKAGFVFRRGESFAGRLSGSGGVGHGMRGNGG